MGHCSNMNSTLISTSIRPGRSWQSSSVSILCSCTMNRILCARAFLLIVLCALSPCLQAAAPFLNYGSQWLYFDNGYQPDVNWAQPGFDDSEWNAGSGQFGYG